MSCHDEEHEDFFRRRKLGYLYGLEVDLRTCSLLLVTLIGVPFQVAIFRARMSILSSGQECDFIEGSKILRQAQIAFLREGNYFDGEKVGEILRSMEAKLNSYSAEVEPVAQFLEANKYNISTISAGDVSSLRSVAQRYCEQKYVLLKKPQYLGDFLALLEAGEDLFVGLASYPGVGERQERETLCEWYRQWYSVLVDHAVIKQDPAPLEASGASVLQRYDAAHRKAFGEASDVGTNCAICLNAKIGNVAPGLHILQICRHSFHTVCWNKYCQSLDGRLKECPCCRSDLILS